jgi:hypothetical protein
MIDFENSQDSLCEKAFTNGELGPSQPALMREILIAVKDETLCFVFASNFLMPLDFVCYIVCDVRSTSISNTRWIEHTARLLRITCLLLLPLRKGHFNYFGFKINDQKQILYRK